ncbi:MAG TPA: Imm50 family immunity protein [Verrucomicrobiota bacterium]|nr:Imm50 family immunity protein [Verrucomicrobiota bacterium]
MASIESLIAGSEKLTRIYGGWPSFHDAEVVELHHWRGQMKPGSDWDDSNVMPVLTAKIHILIQSPTSQHTLATLRFEDVDDFRMEGFNHQNAIFELTITVQERGTFSNGERLPPYLIVTFQAAFGMSASFRCFRIEVVDAVRCTDEGKVYA